MVTDGKYSVNGISCSTGFKLDIEDKKTGENFPLIAGHYQEEPMARKKLREFILLVLLAFLYPLINRNLNSLPLSNVLFYCLVWDLQMLLGLHYFLTLLDFRKDQKTREWHACEHKSAELLERDLTPTLENLKQCLSLNLRCGTSMFGSFIMIILLMTWSITVPALKEPLRFFWNSFAYYTLIVAFSGAVALALKLASFNRISNWVFGLLVLPFAAIPLLFERFCALKEPSEEKLNLTVESLKKLLEGRNG